MKAVFVGGGAHRLLPILRGALAEPGVLDGGEIHLHDPQAERAGVLGRLLLQTPECRARGTRVTWGDSLDEALEGAAVVGVVLMAGTPRRFAEGNAACARRGFIGSDNVSPAGAFLAAKTAPIVLDVARRMERICPDAWLVDFANPVAVMSALVSRHTRIKAMGVCQGFTNHRWDLARLLGRDEERGDIDVDAAGINHLSFITRGTVGGKDLFGELERSLDGGWTMPELQPSRTPFERQNIARSVANLIRFRRELDVTIFSTEPDGMAHLYHDEYVADAAPDEADIEARLAARDAARAEANRLFAARAGDDLDAAFWDAQGPGSPFSRLDDDIFIRVLRGVSGAARTKVAVSVPNRGAIEGLPDDAVVEYSQHLFRDRLEPAGRYRIPPVVHGLIGALAVHQTMLADACFSEDPRLFAQALLAYPVRPYTRAARDLYRELIGIHRDELPPGLSAAAEYLS